MTPIESPIRDFLRSQPAAIDYAERVLTRFFLELVPATSRQHAPHAVGTVRSMPIGA